MLINPVEVIRRKRDGMKLEPSEIESFIAGAVNGSIPEYQVTAFLMATYFRGMDLEETTALTKAMIESGRRVEFTDGKPKIDKHSTGGIGDKVSLILSPLVAALGVDVPMVSGRGLGHTGGTLDKLESIPGFRVRLKIEEFVSLTQNHGMAMMGQTEDFVPADKLLYSLRDVTATVECIPLITASILSKKAAEGISGLVLDIKVGTGAFMKTQKDAEKLAKWLVAVGKKLGLRVHALLTDMNQPLGNAIGHHNEVHECVDVLKGKGPTDLKEVTVELAAHMLILGDKATSLAAARTMARKTLTNGQALEKFKEMCRIQGTTIDITEHPDAMPMSKHRAEFVASRSGYITKIDGQSIGMLLVRLGGGRQKASDTLDYTVGFDAKKKLGAAVKKGEPLMTVYFNPEKLRENGMDIEKALKWLDEAYTITAQKPKQPLKLIKKVIE